MLLPTEKSGAWRIGRPTQRTDLRRFSNAASQVTGDSDAYLWSLADLMTLLLIFFIMLYSNATYNSSNDGPHEEEAVAEMNSDAPEAVEDFTERVSAGTPVTLEETEAGPQTAEPFTAVASVHEADPSASGVVNDQMLLELENSFNKDFYVRWDERQPVIVLGERITFDVGEALLLSGAFDALERVAGLISKNQDCRVVISGHTDDRPILTHTFPSNWELSAARAASVAKFLTSHGAAPQRMIIQGRAEFDPLMANTSEENRKANRRVEISLIKKH